MSSDDSDQGGAGRREVAWRVFAAEYDDADFDYSESDEERAPNYVVTPTGARINRLFVVGVLTQVEQVSDDVLRARIVDPTGAFVVYAGQYQPDEMAFLENASPPAFVAVTGKARTFQPDDSDRVFTSVRPESINRVDAATRDRWVVQTAEQTLSRASTFAAALDSDHRGDALGEALEADGVDAGLAAGIPLAIDHYGTTKAYLADVWDLAIDATRVVAGEIDADEVGPLDIAPDEGGDDVSVNFDYSVGAGAGVPELDTATADVGDFEPEEGAESPTAESSTDVGETAEPSDEMSPEADTPPAESRTEVGESEAVSEGSSEPEPTETVEETAEPAETASEAVSETGAKSSTEAEPAAEAEADAESEPSPDLGEAPTSTVDDEPPEVEDAEDAAELQEEIGDDEPPEVESEQETTAGESFEPETESGAGSETGGDADLGAGDVGDEMYEFDEDERQETIEEHGLEFSSGAEVGEPGDADHDASDAEPPEPETPERESELDDDEPNAGEPAEPAAEDVDAETLQDVESAQGGTEDAVNTADAAPEGSETAAAEAPGASIGEDEVAEPEAESEDEDEATEDAEGTGETPEDLEDTVMETMRDLNDDDGVEREMLMAAVVQEYDVTPADVEDALEGALMAGRCYEAGEDALKPI